MARKKETFVVMAYRDDESAMDTCETGFANAEAARKWARLNVGGDGLYQVVSFKGGPFRVAIELAEKRSIVPAPEPAPAAAPKGAEGKAK